MRVLLELIRIIIIFGILGALGSLILTNIYTAVAVNESYWWFGHIAILLLLFVWYRNKLQFSGWYKGKGREKLPKAVSFSLVLSSILLISTPFIVSLFG